jgi:hypothetical protein
LTSQHTKADKSDRVSIHVGLTCRLPNGFVRFAYVQSVLSTSGPVVRDDIIAAQLAVVDEILDVIVAGVPSNSWDDTAFNRSEFNRH